MQNISSKYKKIISVINSNNKYSSENGHISTIAVTKNQKPHIIREALDSGIRIFGENRIQEMITKYESLPKDIEWHMIGHLQRNKVKYIAPFVSLIHGVDSIKLLIEINKQAKQINRVIKCLLQIHIAKEETKYGIRYSELESVLNYSESLKYINLVGLMGMATFTKDEQVINLEFKNLKKKYDFYKSKYNFNILSIGMSGDYQNAINFGSTMIRVGSKIFGERK